MTIIPPITFSRLSLICNSYKEKEICHEDGDIRGSRGMGGGVSVCNMSPRVNKTLNTEEEWVEVFQSAICHPESTNFKY